MIYKKNYLGPFETIWFTCYKVERQINLLKFLRERNPSSFPRLTMKPNECKPDKNDKHTITLTK